jgi:hypothetical protein
MQVGPDHSSTDTEGQQVPKLSIMQVLAAVPALSDIIGHDYCQWCLSN